ncbi:MAG: helix-turn-helix domain-containing protein [Desulfurella sp.]
MNLHAEKIKTQRKKKGMTIKELARKIGYTDAYVSQIETGKVVPSLKVLKKIVDALDLSFREIIPPQNHDEKIFFKSNEHYEFKHSNNSVYEKLLCLGISSKKMQPTYKILKPHAIIENICLKKCEKFGFIVKGTIQLNTGNKNVILGDRDSFYLSSLDDCIVKNIGENNAEILCVDTPPNI